RATLAARTRRAHRHRQRLATRGRRMALLQRDLVGRRDNREFRPVEPSLLGLVVREAAEQAPLYGVAGRSSAAASAQPVPRFRSGRLETEWQAGLDEATYRREAAPVDGARAEAFQGFDMFRS